MDFQLTDSPIDPGVLMEGIRDQRAGACVTFEGRVRNHNDGRGVEALDYEAYGPLAQKEGERILKEARERFQILGAVCVHRTGSLSLGDIAVWVGITSAHRGAAFDACRYVIDEIKGRLPIWKKEHYAGGASEWVNCATAQPRDGSPAGGS